MRLKTNSLKRTVAVLAAVCTLGTCCVAGSVAFAKDEGANTGNIVNKTTSITIHKYKSPDIGTRSDGSVKPFVNKGDLLFGKKPVKGVEFKVCKVTLKDGKDADAKKIDLSTAEGWNKIKDIQELDPSSATKNAASFLKGDSAKFVTVNTDCTTQTTGDDGSATFPNLAESLYYVEESDTKGAQIKDGEKWKSVTVTGKVDPFFITTPLPHKTATSWEWLYDVNVYPKNDTSDDLPTKTPKTPTKLYTDGGDAIIPWDISMPLTPPSDNKAYTKIGFVDSLPEGLTYDSLDKDNVKLVKKGKTADSTASDVKLAETTDYTVTSTAKADSTPAKVKFELSKSRLEEINKDFKNNTYVLKVTLKTKVAKGTKNVTNFITGWIDNSKIGDGDENNPCVPTEQNPCDKNPHGTSHFATLKITKVAMNASTDKDQSKHLTDNTLKGAIFAVYVMKDQSKELNTVTKDNLATTTDPVKKGTNNDPLTIETGSDGTASVDLFIANDDKTTGRKYCLVETKAPAGFKLNENPICYEVKSETKDQVTAGLNNDNAHKIGNDQATELDKILSALPMTGARGLVLLTAFGIVGLGGTLFYIITRRRKEQEEA